MRKCHNNVEHTIDYDEEFDAEFCRNCNEWVENTCTDLNCYFCKSRPLFPLFSIDENVIL